MLSRNLILLILVSVICLSIQKLYGQENNSFVTNSISTNFIETNGNTKIVSNELHPKEYKWYIGLCPLGLLFSFIPFPPGSKNAEVQPGYGFESEYRFDTLNSIAIMPSICKFTGVFSDMLDQSPFPGYIWQYSIGICYQRYIWGNLYILAGLSPQLVTYYNNDNKILANGFQLYISVNLGYRFDFDFYKVPFYIKIFFDAEYMAYNNNVPQNFQEIMNKSSRFTIIPIPGIELGLRF